MPSSAKKPFFIPVMSEPSLVRPMVETLRTSRPAAEPLASSKEQALVVATAAAAASVASARRRDMGSGMHDSFVD
jgi:hypothetical protein